MTHKKRMIAILLVGALLPVMPLALPAEAADYSNLYINEICTQNKECLLDSYGTASDWIEFYNAADESLALDGLGVTDDAANPMKWTFPSGVTIAAHSYLVVFASKQASTATEYHTGFALSKSGETVTLSSADGTTLQQVAVPALAEDQTYGRSPSGSETLAVMTPTPNADNLIAVREPTFSAQSGFYDADFTLTLQAAADVTIYYTLDGSDPTTSDTAVAYTDGISIYDRSSEPNVYSNYQYDHTAQSITIYDNAYQAPSYLVDKATIVRAVARDGSGNMSHVITNTYFRLPADKMTSYEGLPVVSLVTAPDNLFDPDTGIYVTGNQYLEWKNSSSYDASIGEWSTQNKTNFYSKGKAWERPVSVSIFENGVLAHTQEMGIRVKGASTRNSAHKSFNLYARSDYGDSKLDYAILEDNVSEATGKKIKKYDSITLRTVGSPSRLRDSIAQKMLEGRTLDTQEMRPCVVFLDGEYWGMYNIVEKYSDYYIQSHYDVPKENVVMIKNNALEEGTEQDLQDYYALIDSFGKMDFSDPVQYADICSKIDIESLIEHYCAGLYLGTVDWPGYNYGMWRYKGDVVDDNPYTDGKWRIMSFDFDFTMGETFNDFGGVAGYAYNDFPKITENATWGLSLLFVNLMDNEDFREQFVNTYCDYANGVMTPERIASVLQPYKEQYTVWVAPSMARWFGYSSSYLVNNPLVAGGNQLNAMYKQIETFFANRAAYTLEDMTEYFGIENTLKTLTLKANGSGSFRVNTITPTLTDGSWSGQYSTKYPVTVTAIPAEGETFIGWSGDLDAKDATIVVSLQEIANLQANFSDGMSTVVDGDLNADGICDALDVALLQNWLLNRTEITTAQGAAADFDENGNLNVVDLMMLKQLVLQPVDEVENMLPSGEKWETYTVNHAAATYTMLENVLTASVTNLGKYVWDVQQYAPHMLSLTQGESYELSFRASSTAATTMRVVICRQRDDGNYVDTRSYFVPVSAEQKFYRLHFTNTLETADNWYVAFNYGNSVGDYTVSDFCLTPYEK